MTKSPHDLSALIDAFLDTGMQEGAIAEIIANRLRIKKASSKAVSALLSGCSVNKREQETLAREQLISEGEDRSIIIDGFDVDGEFLSIPTGGDIRNPSDVINRCKHVGNDVIIDIGNWRTITLKNVNLAHIKRAKDVFRIFDARELD